MSHLNAISGFSQLLAMEPLTETQELNLVDVLQAARRLEEDLQALLVLSEGDGRDSNPRPPGPQPGAPT